MNENPLPEGNMQPNPAITECVMLGLESGFKLQEARNCIFIGDFAGNQYSKAENLMIIHAPSVHIEGAIPEGFAKTFGQVVSHIFQNAKVISEGVRRTVIQEKGRHLIKPDDQLGKDDGDEWAGVIDRTGEAEDS